MTMTEGICSRRSVRSFSGEPLREEDRDELLRFAASVETPWGLPIDWRLLDAKEHGLTSPVITGTDCWLAGKIRRAPHAEEAFGYAFERVALHALARGVGTTCIAGTMNRPAFERAMDLAADEVMPCVTPLGYPAAKPSLRESMMRKAVKADSRLPFEELFFDGGFDRPLSPAKAGAPIEALELVRLAPSAVNRQPWRAVLCGDTVWFYEKKSRGFVGADGWDMQKIDLGIALCHFACALEEQGRKARFLTEDPGLPCPADTVFIAGFRAAAALAGEA